MVFHPEGGKCYPGGQKLHWNDVVTRSEARWNIIRLETAYPGQERVERRGGHCGQGPQQKG